MQTLRLRSASDGHRIEEDIRGGDDEEWGEAARKLARQISDEAQIQFTEIDE